MQAPKTLEIVDVMQARSLEELKVLLDRQIRNLEAAYRLLFMDIKIFDFRELPPHQYVSFSRWKWVEEAATGDLILMHREGDVWSDSGWRLIGDLSRQRDQ